MFSFGGTCTGHSAQTANTERSCDHCGIGHALENTATEDQECDADCPEPARPLLLRRLRAAVHPDDVAGNDTRPCNQRHQALAHAPAFAEPGVLAMVVVSCGGCGVYVGAGGRRAAYAELARERASLALAACDGGQKRTSVFAPVATRTVRCCGGWPTEIFAKNCIPSEFTSATRSMCCSFSPRADATPERISAYERRRPPKPMMG